MAFLGVEIIINIIFNGTFGLDVANAAAVVTVPVVICSAVNGGAFASAGINVGVEVVVVRADLWATDTFADAFVPDQAGSAVFGCALACAVVDVKVLAGRAFNNAGVAFASARAVVPVVISFASVGAGGLNTNAVADLGVKVVRFSALLRLAEAATAVRIEVLASWALVVAGSAQALAVILVPFEALRTGHRLAFTLADVGIKDVACGWAVLDDALKFAVGKVPGVLLRLSVNFRFAHARA